MITHINPKIKGHGPERNKMKKLLLLTLLMLAVAVNAFAVQYNPDGLTLTQDEISEVQIIPVIGSVESTDDYPVDRHGNPTPDGWVLKDKLVYPTQKLLYEDARANRIKKPKNYTGEMLPPQYTYFKSKSWEKLPSSVKVAAYMVKETAVGEVAWSISVRAVVDTTQTEHHEWTERVSQEGFDSETAAIFLEEEVIFNSHFFVSGNVADSSLTGQKNPRNLSLVQFTRDRNIKDEFVRGLIDSGMLPKEKAFQGTIIYFK